MTLDEMLTRGIISPAAADRYGLAASPAADLTQQPGYDPGSDTYTAPQTARAPAPAPFDMGQDIYSDPRVQTLLDAQGPRPPDRPLSERLARLGQEFFMPLSAARNEDTPEARRAYREAWEQRRAEGGGKLPGVPGGPVFEDTGTGIAADVLGSLAGKGAGAIAGVAAKPFLGMAGATAARKAGAASAPYTWMSTRLPSGANAVGDPLREQLRIDTDAMNLDPKFLGKVIERIKKYPNLTEAEKEGTPAEVAENFKNHIKDNVRYVYNKIPEDISPDPRPRMARWYWGGNRIVKERANDVGIPITSSAATYGAQSPQKDWYMNASLGDRVLHTIFNRGNEKFTPDMLEKAQELYLKPGMDPQEYAAKSAMLDRLTSRRGGVTLKDRLATLSDKLKNNTATRDDIEDMGAWVRTFDETNHDPRFAVLSPEGDYLDFPKKTLAGADRRLSWGSNLEAGRAVAAAIANGDPRIIRPLLGNAHKVPNFTNNLGAPGHPAGDFTGDTHAIAVALLRPLAAKHPHVAEGFSGPPDAIAHGLKGWYGLMADAHRELAQELRLHPHEVQSIGWEGGRGLFPREFKDKKGVNLAAIDKMWRERGSQPIADVQDAIHEYAGGINTPDWLGMKKRRGLRWDFFK